MGVLRKQLKPTEMMIKRHVKATAENLGIPNNRIAYIKSLQCDEAVEHVHCKLPDAHVFQLSRVKTDSEWMAESMKNEVWQGTVKVVSREGFSGLLLLDRLSGDLFAVCPLQDVERCADSSRYFVVQVEDEAEGQFGYFGIAFKERTAAFDFNVAIGSCKKAHDPEPTESLLKADTNHSYAMEAVNKEGTGSQILVPLPSKSPSPNIHSAGFLLKPHKNDKKKRARRYRKKKTSVAPSPIEKQVEFASFDSFIVEESDEEAARVQKSRCFYGLCCTSPCW